MGSVKGLTRRRFLESIGVAAGGLVLPSACGCPTPRRSLFATAGFGSSRALRAAMHVHGSWSEGDLRAGGQLGGAAVPGREQGLRRALPHRPRHPGDGAAMPGRCPTCRGTGGKHGKTRPPGGWSQQGLLPPARRERRCVTNGLGHEVGGGPVQTPDLGVGADHQTDGRLGAAQQRSALRLILTLSYHPPLAGRPAGQYKLILPVRGEPPDVAGRRTTGSPGSSACPGHAQAPPRPSSRLGTCTRSGRRWSPSTTAATACRSAQESPPRGRVRGEGQLRQVHPLTQQRGRRHR